MELRQLEYFQMVSRYRNITRAAQHLNVSQPNITVSIKKLESELGVTLFDRGQKHISLTPEGRIFLNRTDSALRQIQDAILEVNDYKNLHKGSIKIGIPAMIGAYMFPKIFRGFQKSFPYLDIYIYEEGSMAIRDMLEKDDLDLGIVILSDASNKIERLPMTNAQIVCCIAENNDLAKKDYISIEDLKDRDLIMLKEGSYLRSILTNQLKKFDITTNVILESNQIESIKNLVSHNVGITFLFDFVAKGTPGIKTIPFKDPMIVEIGIAWKKDRYVSKASQSFIDFYSNNLEQLDIK